MVDSNLCNKVKKGEVCILKRKKQNPFYLCRQHKYL